MNKLVYTIFLLAFFFVETACNQADPKVIAKIDHLLVVLDSTNKKVSGIDFEKEEEQTKKIKEDLNFIQTNFTDTLSKEMGFVLSDYRGIIAEEGESGGGENREKMLKKELDYTKKQLLDLKHDFEKAKLPEADFKKYFETESTTVSKLHAYVNLKQLEFNRKETQYNTLQPKVQAFLDSLKK